MTVLFKTLPAPDRAETRLVYEAAYYPLCKLSRQHKIAWSATRYYSKQKLLDRILDDKLYTAFDGTFSIHWEYNNIPTEIEWNKLHDETVFTVELRISPLCGRVALLTFGKQ